MLESMYNWKGIMIEYDGSFEQLYKIHRPLSIYKMTKLFELCKKDGDTIYISTDKNYTLSSSIK